MSTTPPVTVAAEPVVLSVRGLTKDFGQGGLFSRRTFRALNDVSFDIGRGEIVALVGESGSGKSTIARIIARLEKPSSGTFLVNGEDIVATEPRRASRH
jgi:peptide/nickel transport system ATP-binding protein